RMYSGRYVVFPTALALLSLAIVIDGLPARGAGLAAMLLGAVIAWAWAPSFAIPPLADLHWAMWMARFKANSVVLTGRPIDIPVNGHPQRIHLEPLHRAP